MNGAVDGGRFKDNAARLDCSTQHDMSHTKPASFEVVAVGASAGGLDALRRLLAPLPAGFPLPLLIVQHLAPQHASMLAQILSRHTHLAVKEAEDGEILAPGHVYLAPPSRHLIAGPSGTLNLADTGRVHFSRPSVDTLFKSVAEQYGGHAIAIVLTGAGRDGAAGLQAIKEVGGMTIVQDPRTAEYASMPDSAVATQSATHVLPLEHIPALLLRLVMQGEGA